jgi:PhoH-like ATPase
VGEKLDPYMQPLYDNLTVIRHQFSENSPQAQRIQEMRESEKLLVTPLAYIRGRSLQKIFFIVDEAQNLTPHEIKTIITRAGEGTKIVFTGDIRQIDQPYLDTLSNGLSYLINRMVGQSLYAHVTLEKGERSALADLASELL